MQPQTLARGGLAGEPGLDAEGGSCRCSKTTRFSVVRSEGEADWYSGALRKPFAESGCLNILPIRQSQFLDRDMAWVPNYIVSCRNPLRSRDENSSPFCGLSPIGSLGPSSARFFVARRYSSAVVTVRACGYFKCKSISHFRATTCCIGSRCTRKDKGCGAS